MKPELVVLIGEMGAGKTVVGTALASLTGLRFLDSDRMIESRRDATGADIARDMGVATLHGLELEVFLDAAEEDGPIVIAPAASVVDDARGRAVLQSHAVVWLKAPDHVLEARSARGEHRRSIDEAERQRLRGRRASHLEGLADIELDTSELLPEELAYCIATSLGITAAADPAFRSRSEE